MDADAQQGAGDDHEEGGHVQQLGGVEEVVEVVEPVLRAVVLLAPLPEDLLDLGVEPAERPDPNDHLELRDLARVLAVLVDATLPHPRAEPTAHGPRHGPE